MKAVLVDVREQDLAHRRKLGLDHWDEMWEGVLHMTPAPSSEHQRILARLIAFLLPIVEDGGRGTLRPGINVFDETSAKEDYRIPDLTFVAAGRKHVLAADGVRGGGPDLVLEIYSPGDETYEKLTFYATIGVRELIIVHRDTKVPELYRLAGPQFVVLQADAEGWLGSELLGVRFRSTLGDPPRLTLEQTSKPSSRIDI